MGIIQFGIRERKLIVGERQWLFQLEVELGPWTEHQFAIPGNKHRRNTGGRTDSPSDDGTTSAVAGYCANDGTRACGADNSSHIISF
jgi:hypothetical protein